MSRRVSIFNVVSFGIITVGHFCTALKKCGASSAPEADNVHSSCLWCSFPFSAATKQKEKVAAMNESKVKRILQCHKNMTSLYIQKNVLRVSDGSGRR